MFIVCRNSVTDTLLVVPQLDKKKQITYYVSFLLNLILISEKKNELSPFSLKSFPHRIIFGSLSHCFHVNINDKSTLFNKKTAGPVGSLIS